MAPPTRLQLLDLIESRTATVGVVGLGYVGLPLALAFGEAGFGVLGFDVDEAKVASLNGGRSYLLHFPSERIGRLRESERLEATANFDRLSEPDAIIVCVPTPLDEGGEPDLGYVRATTEAIAPCLRPGQLVVLESTTYPGTTEEILKPQLDASGLECGTDYFLAYSPEREDPGNPDFGMATIPKVVGGADAESLETALALYGSVVRTTVPVSSTRVAEASKLTENIFRAVNIALVNELKMIFDSMEIDVNEVLDAASTKPFGFMRFTPGPGWGGHCIPVDPFYLAWKAERSGNQARFIRLAGEINREVPEFVLGKLGSALEARGRELAGARVLIVGLAYKKDVADPRESPAFEILSRLEELGAEVSYHDPYIPELPAMRSWPALAPRTSVDLTPEVLTAADAAILVTDHSCLDYELIGEHARLIVDTRGTFDSTNTRVVKA